MYESATLVWLQNELDIYLCLQEECSFVSLRDVKRVLDVMSWFYEHRRLLFCLMDEHAKEEIENNYACDDKGKPEYKVNHV